jgi:ParB family chromosome partitioning protein
MSATPLGRGLGSLIPKRPSIAPPPVAPIAPPVMTAPTFVPPEPAPVIRATPPAQPRNSGKMFDIPIGLIDPNPHQPRHHILGESLDELVDSIRQHGILQPVIVTRNDDRYQLIAGERRFRAAERLGLPTVPAIIRESRELEQLEIAIVENVQRQDLNPNEEAMGYQQLSEEFGLTQEDIARKVGKRRTTIANALRILSLPAEMQQALRDGRMTSSHAKILLTAVSPQDRQRLFNQILEGKLPVRAAAELGQNTTVRRHVRRNTDPMVQAMEDELRTKYGTKVKISKRDQRGSVAIEFYSDEEFQQLINRLR